MQDYDESYGALFFADIEELGQLPNLEIGEVFYLVINLKILLIH